MKLSRRSFLLAGVAASALLSLPAEARFPRGGGGFNGGRSQINMNYMPTSGDYPFINMVKGHFPGWKNVTGFAGASPDILNSDGYPISLSGTGGGLLLRIFIPTQAEKPGNWKMTWSGSGNTMAVAAAGGVSTVAGNLTGGSYEFSLTGAAYYLDVSITTLGASFSNLQVFHVSDEADLTAGNVFSAKFKAKLRELKVGCIRFLNWQSINTQMSTVWAYRKPTSYFSWAAPQTPPELFAGSATNSGGTYAVIVPGTLKHSSDGSTWVNGDAPKDRDTIIIRAPSSGNMTTGSMTLRVGTGGSTSDLPVVNPSCASLSSGGNDYPVASHYGTYIYEAQLGKWMKWGGDSTGLGDGDMGIDNGIPIEVALQLCAEVGAHPWFSMPPYTLDPMTDYVPSLVSYVVANQQPWMKPRFEPPNELWNPIFYVTYYATAKTTSNWPPSVDYNEWYGKVASTMAQAVATAYGVIKANVKTQTKYQTCVAVQTGSGNTTGACVTSDPRMTSAAYVAQAAAPQSPYAKDAAKDWTTHATVANYYLPAMDNGGINPPCAAALAASLGAVRFIVTSCSGGNLVVSSIETPSGSMATGMTLVGLGIPSGVTITGGTYPNFTISNSSLTLVAGYQVYAYVTANYSALQEYIDTCGQVSSFNASTSGSVMTVHSTSNPTTGPKSIQVGQYLIYSGGWNNSYIASLGTGTGGVGTYNLNSAPGPGALTTANVQGAFYQSIPFYAAIHPNWKSWAQGHGVQNMNFYEGGYSPDYTGNLADALTCMKYLGKFVTSTPNKANGQAGYLRDYYDQLTGLSGGGFTAEFPSQYLLAGPYPSIQAWTILETIYQSPNGPLFDAIVAYNQ